MKHTTDPLSGFNNFFFFNEKLSKGGNGNVGRRPKEKEAPTWH